MKRSFLEKWKADLRAGHPQAKYRLFNGEGHCCLGRAVLIAGYEFELTPDGDHVIAGDAASYIWSLSTKIEDHLRITQAQQSECIRLNDECGLSFHEIAERLDDVFAGSIEEDL